MSGGTPGLEVRADMAEQPDAVGRIFAGAQVIAEEIRGRRLLPARGIICVARGSSDNAAVYARYMLELATRVPVSLAAPSLVTRYESRPDVEGWIVVAISQSGATPEIVATVDALCSSGARAIAITNDESSPLSELCDMTVPLRCGPERAIPATKTFTASIAAIAVISRAFAPSGWTTDDEHRVVENVNSVLADERSVEAIVDELLSAEMVSHLGRGFNYSVALEGALKYREMTGRVAEGMSASDYLHGPIAAANARTHVVAYLDGGRTEIDVRMTADAARSRGAHLLFVTADAKRVPGEQVLLIPPQTSEALTIFSFAIRAQQLALVSALRSGVDPDEPVGLFKVTMTA